MLLVQSLLLLPLCVWSWFSYTDLEILSFHVWQSPPRGREGWFPHFNCILTFMCVSMHVCVLMPHSLGATGWSVIMAFLGHTHLFFFTEGHNTKENLYSKTCLKQPLKKTTKIGFQDRLSLNAGQKYCRMLPKAFCNTFNLH